MAEKLCLIVGLMLVVLNNVSGFPDGAPVDACVKDRPNQPYHAQIKPQPQNTDPYQIAASSNQYAPGKQITGIFFLNYSFTKKTNKLKNYEKYRLAVKKPNLCETRKLFSEKAIMNLTFSLILEVFFFFFSVVVHSFFIVEIIFF